MLSLNCQLNRAADCASIDALILAPFTTDSAEFSVLENGKAINIGYVPPQDVPVYKGGAWCASGPCSGPNNPQLAEHDNLSPLYGWSVNYFPPNFTSTTSP